MSRSWTRMLGWIASRSGGISKASTSDRGVVHVSWWASGWGATGIPTLAPMRGPQIPPAIGDPRTDAPVVGADPRHRVLAEEPRPALHRATSLRLGHANGVGEPVRGPVIGSEDLRPV